MTTKKARGASSMDTERALLMLSGLAQGSRLTIFRLLIEHAPNGLAVGDIVERLGMANATLSFHLKELTHAGLITRHPRGRHIFYAASLDAMNGLIAYLTENCCAGMLCGPGGRSRFRRRRTAADL